MTPFKELTENPRSVTVDGETVTVERKRSGKVSARCTCSFYEAHHWCRHMVDALCLKVRDDPLEEIYIDTPIENQAQEVDGQLERASQQFADLRRILDMNVSLPDDPDALGKLASAAHWFSETADLIRLETQKLMRAAK